ncbi:3-deoxy-manno-octulosonate cytidylyltransferase [Pseudomonas aeruginosa]|nr:3-deoxy-manno-octulosonate cytidylyltransferase [Pseudomonas aeruginosa]MBG7421148.1 3-deoxy-manno-octulosonate cytidylyltransferase [Pseudomonas aeruginosa]
MKYAVVIPARHASTRLPGKPLLDLCGVPMIVRTYRQCIQAVDAEHVLVATDDERIRAVCEGEGIRTFMTSSRCLTGTDRVAEVAGRVSAEIFINVQGDEPLFNPDDLRKLIDAAQASPEAIINGYCGIADETTFRNPSVPKVVFRPDGRLLYMSRAAIPTTKQGEFSRAWRQVCVYAFPREALRAFAARPTKTSLEEVEDIEILRFLELGWEVKMIEMSDQSISVDNLEDVERVLDAILQRKPRTASVGGDQHAP